MDFVTVKFHLVLFFNLVISSKLSISRRKSYIFHKRTSNDYKIEIFRYHSSNEYQMNSYTEYCDFVTCVTLSWIKTLPVVIKLHDLNFVYAKQICELSTWNKNISEIISS